MDKNLTVTKEHLPQRCEVCHQSDMFVAVTGECGRCKAIAIEKKQVSVTNLRTTLLESKDTTRNVDFGLGVIRIFTAIVLGLSLFNSAKANGFELVHILVWSTSFVGGVISLIQWSYLKDGKISPIEKYRSTFSKIVMFLLIATSITQQLLNGAFNIYLSLLALMLPLIYIVLIVIKPKI